MENANPTILNAADLPTRKQSATTTLPASKRSKKPDLYDGTIFANAITSAALFEDPLAADSVSESDISEHDDEDLLEEPIDEQEIYGSSAHTTQ
jgi:hypothetical protein